MSAALTVNDGPKRVSVTTGMRGSLARGREGVAKGIKGGVKGTFKGATALPGGAIKGVGNAAQVRYYKRNSFRFDLAFSPLSIECAPSHVVYFSLCLQNYSLQVKPPLLWQREPPRVRRRLQRCVFGFITFAYEYATSCFGMSDATFICSCSCALFPIYPLL